VLEQLTGESPRLAAALSEARPAELTGEGLTLAWSESSGLSRRQVEDPTGHELIARTIRAVTGASLRVTHEVRSDHAAIQSAPAEPALSDDELVDRFMEEFDAEELPPENPQES